MSCLSLFTWWAWPKLQSMLTMRLMMGPGATQHQLNLWRGWRPTLSVTLYRCLPSTLPLLLTTTVAIYLASYDWYVTRPVCRRGGTLLPFHCRQWAQFGNSVPYHPSGLQRGAPAELPRSPTPAPLCRGQWCVLGALPWDVIAWQVSRFTSLNFLNPCSTAFHEKYPKRLKW